MRRGQCNLSKDGGIYRTQPWEDGVAETATAELVRQSIVKNQGRIALRGWDEGVG